MGNGRWDSGSWSATRSAYTTSAKPTVDHIYTSRSLPKDLDPLDIKIRESRDSAANPAATALIVGLDVTGSMSRVLDHMARVALGQLVGEIYTRKPISDPHILVMGIGDFECDRAPLQATQFEAENDPLVKQMETIYLEGGGGGNSHESYAAAWLFAAQRTAIDCFEKRGKRGYLFTVGDELPTPKLYGRDLARVFGTQSADDISGRDLYELASATYDIFHVVVEEGDYASRALDRVKGAWADMIGQHVIPLADHTKLSEAIVSAIQVAEGADPDAVAKSWSGDTALVVAKAVQDIAVRGAGGANLSY